MLIDIQANKPLGNYYLMSLEDKSIDFTNGIEFDIKDGWYKLVIEYPESKLKIQEIKINNESLDRLIFTGWFLEESTQNKIQPGLVLYTKGQWEIWLHTNMGMMWQTLLESIVNTDFGSNLFEKYIHTVDKPIYLNDDYPQIIKGFFSNGNGPRYWKKNNIVTPYKTLDPDVLKNIDRKKLHNEMKAMCTFVKDSKKFAFPAKDKPIKGGRRAFRKGPYSWDSPFTKIEELPGEELQRLCKILKFEELYTVTLQTQYPGETFAPHVDVHREEETKIHMQGPCSFILDLAEDTRGHHFKVGRSGCIPVDHGTFFNFNYAHATYNESNTIRPLCILNGKRKIENLDFFFNY
jgi:hypothetical protein